VERVPRPPSDAPPRPWIALRRWPAANLVSQTTRRNRSNAGAGVDQVGSRFSVSRRRDLQLTYGGKPCIYSQENIIKGANGFEVTGSNGLKAGTGTFSLVTP